MSDHLIADGSFINSIVGEGTRFRGELDLNGLLRIDGDYTGTIRTPGKVLVGKNGRAECTIKAGTVVIGGVVKGDIFAAEKVIILSTGMIIGNITCPRLIVEEGVLLDGNCTICAEERVGPAEQKEEEVVPEEAQQFAQTAPAVVNGNNNGNSRTEHTENSKELSAWKG
jgi:cytoskeletal protein CcmA (bactofilin family)